jgi:hypothetical protein
LAWATLAAILLLTTGAAMMALRYGLWLDGEPAPGLFPLLACSLAAAGAMAVAMEMRRHARVPVAAADDEQSRPTPGRLLAAMAVLIAWGLLLKPLGYAASGGLALLALLLTGGVGLGGSVVIAVAAMLGTELLFVRLLEVALPGPAWF